MTTRLPDDDYRPREVRCNQDSSFLDVVHPLEACGFISGKVLTPIQKAITKCIVDNNGSASEKQILDFVTKKWKIINDKSVHQFHLRPCMRLIRLNLSIKKHNRKLFLKDTKVKGNIILGTFETTGVNTTETSVESSEKNEEKSVCEKKKDPEKELINFLISSNVPVTFDEIYEFTKREKIVFHTFHNLPLKRQVRGTLIMLKKKGIVFQNKDPQYWSVYPHDLDMNEFKNEYKKSMSVEELWVLLKSKNIY